MQIQPYLFFDGRCDEAIEFYRTALGAEVQMLMRFKECPQPTTVPPGSDDKVMHAALKIGDSMVMASDGRCTGTPDFQGFALTLNATDDAHARRLFEALSAGGHVRMPLAGTFSPPASAWWLTGSASPGWL